MADRDFRVRVSADTAQAQEKLGAVQNVIDKLEKRDSTIRLGLDANSIRNSVQQTEQLANNIRRTKEAAQGVTPLNLLSSNSLNNAQKALEVVRTINKESKQAQIDIKKTLENSGLGDILNTEKILKKVKESAKGPLGDIATGYDVVRKSIPGAKEYLEPLEDVARTELWKKYGGEIGQQFVGGLAQSIQQGQQRVKGFLYEDFLAESFGKANQAVDTLARLGLAIQGVQLLIGPLASAWSSAFDNIIGQNIRLQQTMLSTQTTLASTGRIVDGDTGAEITDPLQKILSLGPQVEKAINNIRIRSLDLAGVTSQQIIDIFGVVATSIASVGGDIKDAEDLAISFTAALGTLGVPLYQARQEIGSILGGYITEDSLLAKRLQITNQDITKARSSIDGVVGYLQKKLETAVAGQAVSARQFEGVTSNIKEVFEVIGQQVGAPLLAPLLAGLTGIYDILRKIQPIVTGIGKYLSTTIVGVITVLVNSIGQSGLVKALQQGLDTISEPFERFSRAIGMGFGNESSDQFNQYIKGFERIPKALQGVFSKLTEVGNFLKLQVALVVDPINKFLDQTRQKADGIGGVLQTLARAPQAIIGAEGGDIFTTGWDTIASTLKAASGALLDFGISLAKLKITSFTASLRAAADVFEIFGSLLLGRVNLALQTFKVFADFAETELARFLVTVSSINKLINSTDFFGLKPLLILLVSGKGLIKNAVTDIGNLARGFKNAGNLAPMVDQMKNAYEILTKTQAATAKNPVVQNAAAIRTIKQEISGINKALTEVSSGSMEWSRLNVELVKAQKNLDQLKKQRDSFGKYERGAAFMQELIGRNNTKDIAKAQAVARSASMQASGAAIGKALESTLSAISTKLGVPLKELQTLQGAFGAAAAAAGRLVTSMMLVQAAFGALALIISVGLAVSQAYEENQKRIQKETLATAAVLRVLGREYKGVLEAAEGGDIAAKTLINAERSGVQSAIEIQQEKINKINEEGAKINNELYVAEARLKELRAKGVKLAESPTDESESQSKLRYFLNNQAAAKKELKAIDEKRTKELQAQLQAAEALAKLESSAQSYQNIQVLATQRKEIETQIKTFREDLNKELGDKEFQYRMEHLNNEQQIKSAMIQDQKAAIANEFDLIRNNSTERSQNSLKLIEQYKQGLLDAADSEERRRSELIQAEARARKDITDYEFKVGRERAQLERTIGKYKQEVQKEISKQQDFADQKSLKVAMQKAAIQSAFFRPFSAEQNQEFINYTQGENPKGKRYSLEMAYGVGQLYDKKAMGITGYETGDVIAAKATYFLEDLMKGGITTLEEMITEVLGSKADTSTFASALRSEQNSRFNIDNLRNPSRPTPSASFDADYNKDLSAAVERQKQWSTQQLQSIRDVQEAMRINDSNKLQRDLNAFADPSRFGPLKQDYTNDVRASKEELKAAVQQVIDFTAGVSNANSALTTANDQLRTDIFEILKNSNSGADTAQIIKLVDAIMKKGLDNVKVFDGKNYIADAALAMIRKAIEGRDAYVKDNAPNFDISKSLDQSGQLKKSVEDSFGVNSIISERTRSLGDTFGKLNSILEQSNSEVYSFNQQQAKVNAFVQQRLSSIVAGQSTPLSADQITELQRASEAYRQALIEQEAKLRPANEALQALTDRMAMAVRATDAVMTANKTFMQSILNNSQTLAEASETLLKSLSEEVLSGFLDYALRPMREQVMAQMKKLFGVESAQDRAYAAVQQGGRDLSTAGAGLKDAAVQQSKAAVSIQQAAENLKLAATNPNSTTSKLTTVPFTSEGTSQGNQVAKAEGAYCDALDKATYTKNQESDQAGETGKKQFDFGKALSGATQAFGAIAMGIGGAQQMGKGGTYNTLMGLAGIFGALGSITGMFGTGGIFAGRASGGPVRADRPYLVGEIGPELFLPSSDGEIVSNAKSRKLLSAAALAGKTQTFSSNINTRRSTNPSQVQFDFAYQSEVINNVEYVTTDQFRKGMSESAERGKNMAFQYMQNNVSTRRRLGL